VRTALVTGATGQVGAYLVERLAADGWQVRALVRSPAGSEWLDALGATRIAGDVLDAARFRAAAQGCEAIFHAAAAVTAGGGWETFRAANIGGTQNAVEAAHASGAKLLHVSSVAVYGGQARYRDAPTGEDAPLGPLPEGAHYARSKREAEALVLRAHAEGRIWGCAVRPDVIYGRYDRQFVPRAARVMDRGFFPVFRGGRSRMAVVHAASVADGAVRAVDTAAAGGRAYNLANDFDVTVNDLLRLAAEGLGHRVVRVPVAIPLARLFFRILAVVMRLTQGPAMSHNAVNALWFLSRDNPFTSERARRELGWSPPVPPAIGIPDAFRWWKEHGAPR
jgi:nucleoside-diphosphate-sugar epimerase